MLPCNLCFKKIIYSSSLALIKKVFPKGTAIYCNLWLVGEGAKIAKYCNPQGNILIQRKKNLSLNMEYHRVEALHGPTASPSQPRATSQTNFFLFQPCSHKPMTFLLCKGFIFLLFFSFVSDQTQTSTQPSLGRDFES